MTRIADFSQRLADGDSLVGTFQKTPAYQNVELVGLSGMDFIVLDTEHAPVTAHELDVCVMAARYVDVPMLVRVASSDPTLTLGVLDRGAVGILVPHITTKAQAQAIVRQSRYRGGSRGFSPSTRAAGYGTTPLDEFVKTADRSVVIAQIEDKEALDAVDQIAATEGLTGLFIGRADLAISMNIDMKDLQLDQITRQISSVARRAGIVCGTHLADVSSVSTLLDWGLSFFVVGSDQSALKNHMIGTVNSFQAVMGS